MPDDAVPEDAVPGDAGAGGAGPRASAPAPPRTDAVGPALTQVGEALDRVLARPGRDAVDRRAEWTALLASPLPVAGIGADAVLAELVDVVAPNGTRLTDPGFWGWITVAPSTVPVAAAALASVVGGQRYTVTALNLLEEQSLDWLAELFGLPAGMKGVYSSGGSVANLVALGAARQWAYERHGIDAAAEGVTALRPAVYASAEVHHTVQRSCGVLGLGRGCVRLVPTDDRLRMRPDALSAAMDADIAGGYTPVAVVGTAGNDEHRRDRPAARRGRDRPRGGARGSTSTAHTAYPGSSTTGWQPRTTGWSRPTP